MTPPDPTLPPRRETPRVGVVIPTLNEEGRIPLLLDDLHALPLTLPVVVVDGGSSDGTVAEARRRGALVLQTLPGRARQLNAGARALPGVPWLLFLHADSRIPSGIAPVLLRWLEGADPTHSAHFRFRLEGDRWFWRFLEFGQGLRERLCGLPYGDQGLLVSRSSFLAVGGYPELPLMEDVEIIRRLRKHGPVRALEAPIVTSPRRYEEVGPWRGWLRNVALITLYRAGVPPERLARWYPLDGAAPRASVPAGSGNGASGPSDDGCARLLVFARAPLPGRVKTRLARDVGDGEALRIYREIGRSVVDRLRGGRYRTLVHYDPPGARAAMERWLDPAGLSFVAQREGDLGTRLNEAVRTAFEEGASRVAVVGTDIPDLTGEYVVEAFRRLAEADLVLGPAHDGGYYLLAVRRPRPALFREIPWGTARVLGATLERAAQEGLTVHLLPELRDVDTAADLVGATRSEE